MVGSLHPTGTYEDGKVDTGFVGCERGKYLVGFGLPSSVSGLLSAVTYFVEHVKLLVVKIAQQ